MTSLAAGVLADVCIAVFVQAARYPTDYAAVMSGDASARAAIFQHILVDGFAFIDVRACAYVCVAAVVIWAYCCPGRTGYGKRHVRARGRVVLL